MQVYDLALNQKILLYPKNLWFLFRAPGFDFAFSLRKWLRSHPKLTPILTFGYAKIIWDNFFLQSQLLQDLELLLCHRSCRYLHWQLILLDAHLDNRILKILQLENRHRDASLLDPLMICWYFGGLELPCSLYRHFKDLLLMSTRDFSDFYLEKIFQTS